MNTNTLKTFLISNNGTKLLEKTYPCATYYNQYSSNFSYDEKLRFITLIKMQKNQPEQYMLSIKAMLD